MAQGGRACFLIAIVLLVILVAFRSGGGSDGSVRGRTTTTTTPARRPLVSLSAPTSGTSAAAASTASAAAAGTASLKQPPPFVVESETATTAPNPLVQHALPKCSVIFFHHLEKTGGTTLRSVLQRHTQLGEFDMISFVNRFDKLQLQVVLHRLHTLLETPGGLDGLRLAVEIHIGGHLSHPYFNRYTLPDLLLLRSLLRAKGCQCNLVTLLRHPLLHHLSWHYHFCNHRVPLCYWRNPPDCQARLALGMTCHDGPNLAPLTTQHEQAVSFMWDAFDLVGVTELFDEFMVALTDLVGLQRPGYRQQIVASHTLSRQIAQRNWTARSCASLLEHPPDDLMGLIVARMAGSAKNAKGHKDRNGRSSTGGPSGHMECRGYGPCLVPGVAKTKQKVDMVYEEDKCLETKPLEVLRRQCTHMEIDERLYQNARKTFERYVAKTAPPAVTTARVAKLREAGVALNDRAEAQGKVSKSVLEAKSGSKLLAKYESSSGGGVPWRVDEVHDYWYVPHERARYSCVKCSGDVVPEKDLLGCWPLWAQFAPDELAFRCNRSWTSDPGIHEPKNYQKGRGKEWPMPCWQTCWTPMGGGTTSAAAAGAQVDNAIVGAHCTAACPTNAPPAWKWREGWDAQLQTFLDTSSEGLKWKESMAFVLPLKMGDFIWNVY